MIKLVRVDDRFIHGQVVTSWVRGYDIKVIVVVDDEISKDKIQKTILKMATPAGTKVYALSENDFMNIYRKKILDKYPTMLIFKGVDPVLRVLNEGLEIETLNIGGIRNNDDRKQYTKAISLSDEERDVVLSIIDKGVKIDTRLIMSDKSENFEKIIGR